MPLLLVQEINFTSYDSKEIVFAIPKNERRAYKFTPGEYVTLHVPVNERIYIRCYSISQISEENHLVICVKHVPNGIVSTHLFSTLQLGDKIEVEYPEGSFNLKNNIFNPKQSLVFITGGSGITPIIPMIQSLIAKNYKGELILIYGSQNSETIIYKKLLSELEPKLKLTHVLESCVEDEKVKKGRLSKDVIIDLISQLDINLKKTAFYCTGPPVVVNNSIQAFSELGVKSSKIHSEKFFLDNQKYSDGKDRLIRTRTNGKFTALSVSGYQSILDACVENRCKVDYSCRIGQCKRCTCKLLKGKVNFNGQIIECKKTILACQSFPLDETTIIDFKKPIFTRIITNRNYLFLLSFITIIVLLVFIRSIDSNDAILAPGEANTGHESISCTACHVDENGSTRVQIQDQINQTFHSDNAGLFFGKIPVSSSKCLECHNRDNDRHSIHRFNEPKYADAKSKIHPENCISCHEEHEGKRITIQSANFCVNCHQDLSLKNDPINPTHSDVIVLNQWQLCMQCHDYHGNHIMETPEKFEDTIEVKRIYDYFNGGKDPYSEAKEYVAKKK